MTVYRDRKEAGEYASKAAPAGGLASMSKDELLAYAKAHGVTPANAAMSKAELRAAIEGAAD